MIYILCIRILIYFAFTNCIKYNIYAFIKFYFLDMKHLKNKQQFVPQSIEHKH